MESSQSLPDDILVQIYRETGRSLADLNRQLGERQDEVDAAIRRRVYQNRALSFLEILEEFARYAEEGNLYMIRFLRRNYPEVGLLDSFIDMELTESKPTIEITRSRAATDAYLLYNIPTILPNRILAIKRYFQLGRPREAISLLEMEPMISPSLLGPNYKKFDQLLEIAAQYNPELLLYFDTYLRRIGNGSWNLVPFLVVLIRNGEPLNNFSKFINEIDSEMSRSKIPQSIKESFYKKLIEEAIKYSRRDWAESLVLPFFANIEKNHLYWEINNIWKSLLGQPDYDLTTSIIDIIYRRYQVLPILDYAIRKSIAELDISVLEFVIDLAMPGGVPRNTSLNIKQSFNKLEFFGEVVWEILTKVKEGSPDVRRYLREVASLIDGEEARQSNKIQQFLSIVLDSSEDFRDVVKRYPFDFSNQFHERLVHIMGDPEKIRILNELNTQRSRQRDIEMRTTSLYTGAELYFSRSIYPSSEVRPQFRSIFGARQNPGVTVLEDLDLYSDIETVD